MLEHVGTVPSHSSPSRASQFAPSHLDVLRAAARDQMDLLRFSLIRFCCSSTNSGILTLGMKALPYFIGELIRVAPTGN